MVIKVSRLRDQIVAQHTATPKCPSKITVQSQMTRLQQYNYSNKIHSNQLLPYQQTAVHWQPLAFLYFTALNRREDFGLISVDIFPEHGMSNMIPLGSKKTRNENVIRSDRYCSHWHSLLCSRGESPS